jgi:hypothetical protein
MAIQSTVAKGYAARMVFSAVLFLGLGLWGVYDYVVAIPAKQDKYDQFVQKTQRKEELDREKAAGVMPDQAKMDEYDQIGQWLTAQKDTPTPPSALDRATQWFFIASLPFAPWFLWLYVKARRQSYRLDDEGTLHFVGDPALGTGAWSQNEIADIDMSRWMAKSIAWLVKTDSTRLKLDAYLHKDLHLIIGAIANRMHPDDWDAEAKPIKKLEPAPPSPTEPPESTEPTDVPERSQSGG